MPRSQVSRDELMSRLQQHAGLSDGEIEKLKYFCAASHYFSLENHTGGLVMPGQKHYVSDGLNETQITFEDVPMEEILKDLESYIEREIPQELRRGTFKAVMANVRGYANQIPDWDKAPINPNQQPRTHLSASKAVRMPPSQGLKLPHTNVEKKAGNEKNNARIIAELVSDTGMDDRSGKAIACQITWKDAMGDARRPSMLSEEWRVKGGRLGRDHTLEDVPNHFVRDQVMGFINSLLPENRREAARKAVFSDLSTAELREYGEPTKQWRVVQERTALQEAGLAPCSITREEDRQNSVDTARQTLILHRKSVFAEQLSKSLRRQNNALAKIDETIDLMPQPGIGTRHVYGYEPEWKKSVIHSDSPACSKEDEILIDTDFDRDCDQVRAMIKRFTKEGDWTIDQFRHALGLSRPALTHFLEQSGPKQGKGCNAYKLGWEFFKRRESLGLPTTGNSQRVVWALQELDINRGPKREAAGVKGRPAKVQKVAGSSR